MIKLARYLKPYAGLMLAGVLLLFGQALLDLSLPGMMGDIVNIGIQRGGIEETAPLAMAPQVMEAMEPFMSEQDQAALRQAYTPYRALAARRQGEIDKTFPGAAGQNALVLAAEGSQQQEAGAAFGRAAYAVMQQWRQAPPAAFEAETLVRALAAAPPQARAEAVRQAAKAPETTTAGMAVSLSAAVYRQLGADAGRMQTSYMLRVGGVMVLLSVAMVLCAVGAGYCFARIGAGVARDLRRDVFARVIGFSSAEMDKFSTSSLITRTTNDVSQIQILYTMGMRMLVFAPLMGAGGIIMALRKSPGMSWIIGAGVAVIVVIIGVLIKTVMPRFKKMQGFIDHLSQVARENLSGMLVVRAFANQKFQEARFEKANEDLTKNSLFVGRAMTLLMPLMMLIMNGMSLFIVWLGAGQISRAAMQVGDMLAFIQYAMQVITSFLFIAMIFVFVPRASVSAERIDEVLRSESAVQDPPHPKTLGGRAAGEVRFEHVSFQYEGAEEQVLRDVSFTARPGQTTAVIGATGSGKSTLVNLIPRFYDASAGRVTLDGVDVRELSQRELRANIGYVPQKGLLFSGTVASNIRFGSEGAGDEEVRRAAEIAQAAEFIGEMEGGFGAAISQGGGNVSGGQRQRLGMARALCKNAPVYIFDDSFSALDFATDARLRRALKPYTENAAVLVVAQRVATIMTAEQIVVLENGAVAGIGTHRQLLAACATYREIAESQLSREELAL